jgi:hypothetical protein
MKKIGWLIFLFLLVLPISAENRHQLTELLNPQNLAIEGDDLYISEGITVYHYSLKDCKLKKKFGKEGEAPGEFKVYPGQSVQVNVQPDFILVSSIGKITFLSRQGEYIREKKTASIMGTPFIPLNDKFVGTGFIRLENKIYITINIFDSDLKKGAELERYEFRAGQGITFFERAFYFQVYRNLVFISGGKDFIIGVFDSHGNRKTSIRHDSVPVKITAEETENVLNWYKTNPATKQYYEIITNQAKFPSHFPAIRNFSVSGEKIYVQTYALKNQLTEFIILNLEGQIQKSLYLHIARSNPAEQNQLFTIYDNRLYQIIEDEEDELWGLQILEIK